jgi:hypothetical protein
MKYFKIQFLLLLSIIGFIPLAADEIAGIIAYPIPYNPRSQTLTIDDKAGRFTGTEISVIMEIFDFNGDKVYKRSFSAFPIRWKGYSSSGVSAENGLYFIKLTIENLEDGTIEKGTIRILLKK